MSVLQPTAEEDKSCPACGKQMGFLYGSGWDYDCWHCRCGAEIELTTSTYPPADIASAATKEE
jgi:hypothetical protein